MTFTERELEYLTSQPLGRLATAAPDGTLQNSPVGHVVNAESGTIDIGGQRLGASRKFRNVVATREVAYVVDDIASFDPWTVRGVEVRGTAEVLTDIDPPRPEYMSRELIRIHPRRIISWGIDSGPFEMHARDA